MTTTLQIRDQAAWETLNGVKAAGGEQSRRAIGGLLGLYGLRRPLPVQVLAVAWVDRVAQALIEVHGGQRFLFTIEPRAEGKEGIILTEHLVVGYRGGDLPQDMAFRVEKIGAYRLRRYTMAMLAVVLQSDPEWGLPQHPFPELDEPEDRPRSHMTNWGESDAYADFFASDELARMQLDSLDFSEFLVFVQHSDQECNSVDLRGTAPTVMLVNVPWRDRLRDDYRPPIRATKPRSDAEWLQTSFSTNLCDHDVIMGDHGKVRRALQAATEAAEATGKAVFFSNTCVPIVAGDDVDSEIRRCQQSCHCDVMSLTISANSMTTVFERELTDKRLAVEAETPPALPNLVNLVGFPESPATNGLCRLLQSAGAEINALVIPAITEPLIRQAAAAALNVLHPRGAWQHLYDQFTTRSRIPVIAPTAPYGVAGTTRWLASVMEALGLDGDAEALCQAALAPVAERWDRARRQAADHRLLVVLRGEETYFVTDPSKLWGVPLLPFLEEAGFSLDILIKFADKKQAARATQDVHGVFGHPERHVIKGFDSLEMMLDRMSASAARAVLSYHFFDWRATQAGKNMFSLQHLEMGIPGAVNGVERLLGVCQTPFYQRFHRYLRRSRAGVRLPASASLGAAAAHA